jgi:hypothetical protein
MIEFNVFINILVLVNRQSNLIRYSYQKVNDQTQCAVFGRVREFSLDSYSYVYIAEESLCYVDMSQ